MYRLFVHLSHRRIATGVESKVGETTSLLYGSLAGGSDSFCLTYTLNTGDGTLTDSNTSSIIGTAFHIQTNTNHFKQLVNCDLRTNSDAVHGLAHCK